MPKESMSKIDQRLRGGVLLAATAALLCACRTHPPTPSAAPAAAHNTLGATTTNDVFGPGCSQLPPANQVGSLTAMRHQSAAAAIASNPMLSDFAAALRSTPTDYLLNGDRGTTVFAPDNKAFDTLHRTIGDDAFAHLAANYDRGSFLPHHIADRRLTRDDLTRAGTVEVLDGDRLTVADLEPTITVADPRRPPAHVVCGDISTANGTIFIIDAVLVSPNSELAHTSAPQKVHCAPNPHAHNDAVLCFDALPHPISLRTSSDGRGAH